MNAHRFGIRAYGGGRDPEVADFILSIQRKDVGLHVPIEEQPELRDIPSAYRDGCFWVAEAEGAIVGTIGMMPYGTSVVMKKLFVHRDYRGPAGAGHALYEAAIAWAVAQGAADILLDTPSVAARSHAFYRGRGFEVVDRAALPAGYAFPDRDSLIFRLPLPAAQPNVSPQAG